jgi:3-hydroxyacyl-[acyl-carrier-protein] dehydratase
MRLINDFFKIKDIKEQENGQPIYTIVVNENHFIYKAHFPNNPITPGVCMVQMIEEIMKERLNRDIYLSKINNIKFLNVLIPQKDKEISLCFQKIDIEDTYCEIKAVIMDNEQSYAKISTSYSYERI